ncbi:MAG: family 78 glycoside hydrolase catalytic domain [Tepidisphaeraceae bacterium]
MSDRLDFSIDVMRDAQWIGGAGQAFCRHSFVLRDQPIRATLYVMADPHSYAIAHWQAPASEYKYEQWLVGGSFIKYRVFANGELIAVGPYRAIVDGVPPLQQYDATASLRPGRNVLAVVSRGEARGFALAMEVTHADGSTHRIVSGPDWRQREANTVYRPVCWEAPAIDQHFKGGPGPGEYPEHLDGRAYPDGWRGAAYDDSAWKPAVSKGLVSGPVEICQTPPYVVTRLRPREIVRLPDGAVLVDFGRALFGGIELAAPVGGGVVELRLSEELTPQGHARYQLRAEVCYQELWTFVAGSEPLSHFGVRMFRYAEIVGWPGTLDADDITAVAIAAPFDADRSSFTCSDAALESVWELCKNSIAFTTADVYNDCLTRERLAYEADAYVSMLTQFAVEGSTAPARRTIEYLIGHPTWPCEWWQLYVPLFYEYVLQTGDMALLRKHYAFLTEQCTFHRLMKDGLVRRFPRQCNVDWPENCRDGYEFGEANAVANAYARWDLVLLGRMAAWLGREDDVRAFALAADELKDGFNRELWDASSGLYVDSVGSRHSSLHANLYALRFGLVPAPRVGRCLDFIVSRGVACSVFTMQFLLETLFMHGRDKTAVHLMTRRGERSWLEMLERGATVTTESWLTDIKPNMSWAHPWGSAPGHVVMRWLFGLRPTAPGWADYSFEPRPGGLEHGRLRVATPRGTLIASFQRQGDDYVYQLVHGQPAGDARPGDASHGVKRAGGIKPARTFQE